MLIKKGIEWSIRDTEFILRLIHQSKFDGVDVETAAEVLGKIKGIHNKLMDVKVTG